jgi:hypothetical protein
VFRCRGGAALVRDAGFAADVPDRAAILLAEIGVSGISYAAAKLQLALCFHHAVLDAQDDLATATATATATARLSELTQSGVVRSCSRSEIRGRAFSPPAG